MTRRLLLFLLLLVALPAHATITEVHWSNPADGVGSSPALTITSTTSGNSVVALVHIRSSSSITVTSLSGCGGAGWTSASARATDTTVGRAVETWYNLGVSGSCTSVTVNFSSSATYEVNFVELNSSLGTLIFDVGAHLNGTSASNGNNNGPSITTTGTSDAIVGFAAVNSASFNSPGVNSPFNEIGQDSEDNEVFDYLNVSANTYQVVFALNSVSSSDIWATEAAFKEPSGGGGSVCKSCDKS